MFFFFALQQQVPGPSKTVSLKNKKMRNILMAQQQKQKKIVCNFVDF